MGDLDRWGEGGHRVMQYHNLAEPSIVSSLPMQPTCTKEKTGQTIPIVYCGVGYYFSQAAGAAGKYS